MNMYRNEKLLTAVDFFAGAGGLTVGLKRAGFKVVAAVEVDPEIAKTYRRNHPEVKLIVKDVRLVTGEEILKLVGLRKIDLVAGCPPCQGFSTLTDKHHRDDERNQLVREMSRLVRELEPLACMMENVPGLRNRGKPLLDAFEKDLEEMKYRITKDVLQMADYGVPQSRRRLVVLAGKGFDIPLPEATHAREPERGSHKKPWVKLREVLKKGSEPVSFSFARREGGPRKFNWHVVRDLQPISLKRLQVTKPGASRLSLPASLRPDCHQGTGGFENTYGRMSWDDVAPTMTSGCTTLSSGRFGHPVELRTISVREAALIQTFPMSYQLETDLIGMACELIGNALPCKFAAAVSRQCANVMHSHLKNV